MTTVDSKRGNGILAIWHDCADGREEEFEAWYQGEHLEERMAVPGFLYGRRHEALSGEARYFALYVTESPAALTSPAYQARLDDPTPMTRTVMTEIFQNMTRTVCTRAATAGLFRGVFAVTLRFDTLPDTSDLKDTMTTFAGRPGVACAEVWLSAEAGDREMGAEERLRGGDRKIAGCLIVETLRQGEAETAAHDLAAQFPDAETGLYRVLCQSGDGDA